MEKKKIIITGGGGFAAGNIIYQAMRFEHFEVHAIELRNVPLVQARLEWHVFDLQNGEELKNTINRVNPDVIVHTAAVSDIDYCEAHQEIAEKTNVGVTELLVSICNETKCRLIYFSSDSVFDGIAGNYTEEDQPKPVNFYANTKVRSENLIRENSRNWVIVRPSLIMGFPVKGAGNSFLWRMVKTLRRGEAVAFPRIEVRSPIDVITLSRAILELADHSYCGILHLSGNNALSRFDMARSIATRLGYPAELIVDKKPSVETGRAPRPRNVSLSNIRAKKILETPMLDLDEGIDLIIENMRDTTL